MEMVRDLALDVLPEQIYMERKKGSKVMLVKIDKPMMEVGTIIPITVGHKYIVSEAKVVDSDIFTSQLKVILIGDSPWVPSFECYNPNDYVLVELPKGMMGLGKSDQGPLSLFNVVDGSLEDLRPVAGYRSLFERLPNLMDYNGLKNLQMNVRFK